ncbi:MAG: hypothetical protein IPL53_15240 [Ignavibacteria bacterium]|nr:hypothetical protein [Ignavibacteria bacterium]
MKKTIPTIILLILPVILILLTFYVKLSVGEFCLYRDPAYVYLINSLNLAQLSGYGAGHLHHPGTPVQVLGAVVIKFYYTLQGQNTDIVRDVFLRPEFYLERINLVIVLITAFALFILGLVAFKKSGNIYSAIVLQLSPLSSSTIYLDLANVSPEPFLIFTTLLLITIIISYTNKDGITFINNLKYAIGFGIICGFGLAVKISFFPILLIPLVLIRRFSFKIYFLLFTALAFLIFILPVLSSENIVYFFRWIKMIITHSDLYGQGSENFVNVSSSLKNLKNIIKSEPVFTIAYILTGVTIILRFIPRFKNQIQGSKYFSLLTGIFFTMSVQLLIVSKHFNFRYMLPVLMLSVLTIYCVTTIAADLFLTYSQRKKIIYLFLTLLIFLYFLIKSFLSITSILDTKQKEANKIINYLEGNCKQSIVIGTNMSSCKESSYYWGTRYAGSQWNKYYSIFQSLFPNRYTYNIGLKGFELVDKNYLKTELIRSKIFIFHCKHTSELDDFMSLLKQLTNKNSATYKIIFSNQREETIYEIVLDPF